MAISAELVKHLRDKTGAGMADCKKALEEANGDEQKAIEVLRKKGAASAAKRSDREAKEGIIVASVSEDHKHGVLAEVNSETDFVARNESFVRFAQDIADAALKTAPNSHEEFSMVRLANGATISEEVGAQTGRLGEKLEARRFEIIHEHNGFVTSYIHPGAKLGVLVAIAGGTENATLGRDIAMQIAAMNPMAVDRTQISTEQIEKELEIYRTQATQRRQEGRSDRPHCERQTRKILSGFLPHRAKLYQGCREDGYRSFKRSRWIKSYRICPYAAWRDAQGRLIL